MKDWISAISGIFGAVGQFASKLLEARAERKALEYELRMAENRAALARARELREASLRVQAERLASIGRFIESRIQERQVEQRAQVPVPVEAPGDHTALYLVLGVGALILASGK